MKYMNVIETNKLTKTYGNNRGINELELKVLEGDFFGFIGPNGAGKSTTIRTLLGLIKPTDGSAKVLGFDIVSEKEKILKNTGYLPSEINFYNGMKVWDVIKYSLDLRGVKKYDKARSLSERLGVDLDKKVSELSLGNRKKVGIITAIAHSPKLLILDEPTSGLDPLMQREFFNILNEENKRGATIFLSSHILSEVQSNCKTAAFIKDGKIIMSDKVENIEQTGTKKVVVKTAEEVSEYLYKGEVNELIKELAMKDIVDVSITEPSLEEIFMEYYE